MNKFSFLGFIFLFTFSFCNSRPQATTHNTCQPITFSSSFTDTDLETKDTRMVPVTTIILDALNAIENTQSVPLLESSFKDGSYHFLKSLFSGTFNFFCALINYYWDPNNSKIRSGLEDAEMEADVTEAMQGAVFIMEKAIIQYLSILALASGEEEVDIKALASGEEVDIKALASGEEVDIKALKKIAREIDQNTLETVLRMSNLEGLVNAAREIDQIALAKETLALHEAKEMLKRETFTKISNLRETIKNLADKLYWNRKVELFSICLIAAGIIYVATAAAHTTQRDTGRALS